ncbi:hypothetical protein [Telmatospirillum sp. J64-1]|uniref:hypothetical protein n=1 Tax=Telmatospirillum sp. J64-1 TaxID=2502183 RepID=UPI00163DB23D|nr:hypothetical protein [Telmatospirillum sp. J64-1]
MAKPRRTGAVPVQRLRAPVMGGSRSLEQAEAMARNAAPAAISETAPGKPAETEAPAAAAGQE